MQVIEFLAAVYIYGNGSAINYGRSRWSKCPA